jgi:predicted ArsR family transcriptional regulator
MRQAEDAGYVEREPGGERTGKPGRPAVLWRLTDAGKERAQSGPREWKDMLTQLQARRAHALMNKGMSEDQAIAAVTRGWTGPRPPEGR